MALPAVFKIGRMRVYLYFALIFGAAQDPTTGPRNTSFSIRRPLGRRRLGSTKQASHLSSPPPATSALCNHFFGPPSNPKVLNPKPLQRTTQRPETLKKPRNPKPSNNPKPENQPTPTPKKRGGGGGGRPPGRNHTAHPCINLTSSFLAYSAELSSLRL